MRRVEEFWYKFEYETFEYSEATNKVWAATYSFVDSIKLATVVLTIVVALICKPFTVQGDSMLPTLRNGDSLLGTSIYSDFERGDIVVVSRPNSEYKLIIKRIIAVGGDEVDIDFSTGEVYVNGEMLNEDYIYDKTYVQYDVQFPLTVPEGHVFVMGDNRNNSLDSRASQIGLIEEKYITGKTILRLSPFEIFE